MIEIFVYPNAQPPNPAPANPLSLVGGTMSLMIPTPTPASPANPDPVWVPMVINASDPNPVNQFGYYVARPGVDFPTLGIYNLQARLTFQGGILLLTNAFMFTVVSETNQIATFVQVFNRQRTSWPPWFRPFKPWG